MNIETKIRNIRFIGELCKFKIAPPGLVFTCLKVIVSLSLLNSTIVHLHGLLLKVDYFLQLSYASGYYLDRIAKMGIITVHTGLHISFFFLACVLVVPSPGPR